MAYPKTRNMKTIATLILVAACSGTFVSQARAGMLITFVPGSQTIANGASTTVDVTISGLTASLALGAYDLDFSYDPSVVAVTGVTFPAFPASGLDLGFWGSWWFSDTTTPGVVNLVEVSLESAADLSALQPDGFVLATVSFQGSAPGASLLHYTSVTLADENGFAITDFSVESGIIDVVPETPEFALITAMGLLGFGWYRRARTT